MSLAAPDHGPYALGPKIGGGGMAAVYLGKYVPSPGEEAPSEQAVVALKVIKGELVSNPEYEKMFLDEAEILTRLSHPNVIRTVGYGAQAGAWFIAMELLMGRSLLDVWEAAAEKKRAIPFDVAAHVAREVARGLEHAHGLVDEEDGRKLGIVHRDVNPSNVFVGYDGSVKLIDFGLAKARKRQTQSQRGLIKGKIPYLSPEQIKEDALDGRSDVYALGTTLWETVTMRRLFKRDTDVATVRAIQKGEVPDPRTFVEKFPDALWAIVEKSLKQNRDERYASAAAMADDLDRFLSKAKTGDLQHKLALLVGELFPGEAEKQEGWLAEATGVERKTLAPIVPIAQVPEVENSMPVLTPTPPDSDPETETETEAATATPTVAVPVSRGMMVYAAVGAVAGVVVVAAYLALR
ncbi:MAG TPA: serine/threonine-protein kinase [Polyangiaceae bacterium]|jgi:serine/threonine-protein kinase